MKIYSAERLSNLEAALAVRSVRLTASARVTSADVASYLPRLRAVAGDLSLPDLVPVDAVLVSTGMNLNDDLFLPSVLWSARATPVDKPWNYEHESGDIIGHMVDAHVASPDGEPIFECADDFDIRFAGVLYRHWPTDERRQERCDAILANIDKWFVSMECRFADFDYALVPPNKLGRAAAAACQVILRNDSTAYLTRYLRSYGGSGVYQGQRIARVLRDITFSAVGLVRRPANPDSVILTSASDGTNLEPVSDPIFATVGYGPSEEFPMTELEKLNKQLQDALAKLQAAEESKTALAAQVAELTRVDGDKALKAAQEQLSQVQAALAAKTAEVDAVAKALESEKSAHAETQKALDVYKAEAAAAAAAKKHLERVSQVKAAFKFTSDSDADAYAQTIAALDDAAFAAHLETIAKVKVSALPAGETSTSSLPKPMGGGAKPLSTAALGGTTPASQAGVVPADAIKAEDDAEALRAELLAWAGVKSQPADSNTPKK